MEVNAGLTEKGQRDHELIKRALEKSDQQAYAQLVDYYRDSLYFMMLKMTNNQHDADDLTIEAFGKAFKNLKQYTPDYAFSTWLFKIATNNCIDFMRKKKKGDVTLKTDSDDALANISQQIPSQGPDPEESFIKDQKIDLMRDVVQRLKPHYRRLIELRYFKEYSYEEIVEELDLPLGTVKAQLFRAREFLFNILKNSKEKI
ncbi:MAG: RNA polymerase subunit sigma-24 [Bacteroidetes bacterium]|jgi:RNA polymerase sigma-70 factor (ECF subfamily)|nr:MAG: RNA polymerase subunit sigma-24 [Bacteroidota bacterium]RLD47553.1 MAG: RNA polymerase subunit sigma-24 [Bacteroidota bacterium]RLD68625.1 MAG: RNA polymerase subunit sigma-24 [Bacteroidota bacterium]RLD87490.1 MAG: RNA polymerase subunit sigma-24 [Bacteroidota bacterium]HHL58109.1 sigma-70 family RNA polymerase sigma factor [Bacteroidota bacterium]